MVPFGGFYLLKLLRLAANPLFQLLWGGNYSIDPFGLKAVNCKKSIFPQRGRGINYSPYAVFEISAFTPIGGRFSPHLLRWEERKAPFGDLYIPTHLGG